MEVTKKPSIRSDPQDPTALLSASRWSLDGDRLAEHLGIAMLRPSAEEAGIVFVSILFLLEICNM